jgi:hypothetical protein
VDLEGFMLLQEPSIVKDRTEHLFPERGEISHKETQVTYIFREFLEDPTKVRRLSEMSLKRTLRQEKGVYHGKKITFSYGLFEMWNKTKDLNVEVVWNYLCLCCFNFVKNLILNTDAYINPCTSVTLFIDKLIK